MRLRTAVAEGRAGKGELLEALDALLAEAEAERRLQARDELLAQAAALVPGQPWPRAKELRRLAEEALRASTPPAPGSALDLVAQALRLCRGGRPPSIAQLYRVTRTCKSGLEMQAALRVPSTPCRP